MVVSLYQLSQRTTHGCCLLVLKQNDIWTMKACQLTAIKTESTTNAEKMIVTNFGGNLPHCVRSITVTATSYKDIRIRFFQFCDKISQKRLHQNNAPTQWSALLQRFLQVTNFEVVPHVPYSVILAPSNFWLIPTLKDITVMVIFQSCGPCLCEFSEKQAPKEQFVAAM